MLPTCTSLETPAITALVLGSQPITEQTAPYEQLPDVVPGSKIIAVDEHTGDEYPKGWEFCPAVIGRCTEMRPFYRGAISIVSSLYELNWPFLNRHAWQKDLRVTHVEQVETIGLDEFTEGKRPIHFIAADIQGAEGEAFESGPETLADTLMIHTEVGFGPIYRDAPLFRDIDAILATRGFGFYKLLGTAVRTETPHYSAEHEGEGRWMWAEALYVRDDLNTLHREDLLRLATLAHLYGLYTLAASCLHRVAGIVDAEAYLAAVREAQKA